MLINKILCEIANWRFNIFIYIKHRLPLMA